MRGHILAGLLPLATSACMTAQMMESVSLDAGRPVLYDAHPETVTVAAKDALHDEKLPLHAVTSTDTTRRMLLAGRSRSPFSNGEWVRLLIESPDTLRASVRVVSRSGALLDVFHRDRAPLMLRQLDARLAPTAVLVPGSRVRVQTAQPVSPLIGELVSAHRGSLEVRPLAREPVSQVALADVTRLSIHRGNYRHVKEGAIVGSLLGVVAGAVYAGGQTKANDPFADLAQFSGALVGLMAGFVVGAALGSQMKTDVWSDLDVTRLRQR